MDFVVNIVDIHVIDIEATYILALVRYSAQHLYLVEQSHNLRSTVSDLMRRMNEARPVDT